MYTEVAPRQAAPDYLSHCSFCQIVHCILTIVLGATVQVILTYWHALRPPGCVVSLHSTVTMDTPSHQGWRRGSVLASTPSPTLSGLTWVRMPRTSSRECSRQTQRNASPYLTSWRASGLWWVLVGVCYQNHICFCSCDREYSTVHYFVFISHIHHISPFLSHTAIHRGAPDTPAHISGAARGGWAVAGGTGRDDPITGHHACGLRHTTDQDPRPCQQLPPEQTT